ncbi:hypothetical protein C8Q79DRAFT_923542 [Trametes meyenii]|nr:hypothetical protein C8Q79DRAFT_923542 [Trametes meyenii]
MTTHSEAEKKKLQDSIEAHIQEALHLRSVLNTKAPINRLPPDVLSTIFLKQADDLQKRVLSSFYTSIYMATDMSSHKPIYSWLHVASVCRQWREVSLSPSCANLWARIVIDPRVPANIVRLFLNRAQGLPLSVVVLATLHDSHCRRCVPNDRATLNFEEGIGILGEVVSNASLISLFLNQPDYDGLWRALSKSAALLKNLHIEALEGPGAARYNSLTQEWQVPMVPIPNDIFLSSTPQLQNLHIEGATLPWQHSLLCPTLRHLHITGCFAPYAVETEAADISVLLDALRGMPNLESLTLDDTPFSFTAVDPSRSYPAVDLPHLKRLRVPITEGISVALVSQLRIPPTAIRHFAYRTNDRFQRKEILDEATVAAFRDGLLGLLGHDARVFGISCSLRFRERASIDGPVFQLLVQNDNGDTIVPPPSPYSDDDETVVDPATSDESCTVLEECCARFVFDGKFSDSTLMPALLSTLDLRRIQFLSISENLAHLTSWSQVFEGAEWVSTLRLYGEVAFGLGALLARWVRPPEMHHEKYRYPYSYVGFAEPGDDADDDEVHRKGYAGGAAPPFPRLRTIQILDVDFPRGTSGKEREQKHRPSRSDIWEDETGPYGFDAPGLLKALRVRAAQGAEEVVRIDFDRCKCEERERLVPLVKAVREVWWDGKRLTLGDLSQVG